MQKVYTLKRLTPWRKKSKAMIEYIILAQGHEKRDQKWPEVVEV